MKETFGGTWETHKYPGVRSDSDLCTFGYRFKPWVGTPIASAGLLRPPTALHRIEDDNFNPNYLVRDLDKLPQRGDKPEWRHNQDYWAEKEEVPAIDLEGSEFVYDGRRRGEAGTSRGTGVG